MKKFNGSKINLPLLAIVLGLAIAAALRPGICYGLDDGTPIADAGSPRYAATKPVTLDGTDSYDPDGTAPLSYQWQQIAGTSVVITDANTPTPTISGFTQTSDIQECEFELVVGDGTLTSLPDTVKVIIVPVFGASTLTLENPPFNPEKPTFIYFGGGNCINGGGSWGSNSWAEKANVISFPNYEPDIGAPSRTYYRCGDMIIVYLSGVAPDYKQLIQTAGFSTGGQPAVDVGLRLNLTYADARYAVNRVTFLDATSYCRSYWASISSFLASSVDGEQSWADNYDRATIFPSNTLNALFPTLSHSDVRDWYRRSLTYTDMNRFNNGVIGGAYWSVVGRGRNLQLASTPGAMSYVFEWQGESTFGNMVLYDVGTYPGRLMGSVNLLEPSCHRDTGSFILTCENTKNAVAYEVLVGPDPLRVMDFEVRSDTPHLPNEGMGVLYQNTWWTVKARDQYGTTIYADPEYFQDMVDFNCDGRADFRDFSILAKCWLQCSSLVGTAPSSNIVDAEDLAVFAKNWLVCTRKASNPVPPDGAGVADADADLSWTAGTGAESHDVYFGTGSPPPFILNQTSTTFEPGIMTLGAKYYWRIDEVGPDETTVGTIWSFTVMTPPSPPLL